MADQSVSKKLLEPILDQGIQNTHFFNGRLLTAADLKAEQEANRRQHAQLGKAAGEGVVTGLEVRLIADGADGKPPVVRVSDGLALNRNGQALALPSPVDVALSRLAPPLPTEAGLFQPCDRPPSAADAARGVFVLTVGPASGFREQAPRRGLGAKADVEGCGSRFAVEGVRFGRVELKADELGAGAPLTVAAINDLKDRTDMEGLSLLRNLLAHLCFGTEELASFAQGPFRLEEGRSPFLAYGALDALRADGQLTGCEVPLALVYWPAAGVQFVDTWAVRRRVVQPPSGDPWPLHVGQRRLAESEAVFLQFQDQLRAMFGEANLAAVKAKDRFRYLPAAGYLPIDTGAFTRNAFFSGLVVADGPLDPAFLRLWVQQSWYIDPIDLNDPPRVHLYADPAAPGYLLFVRGEKVVVTPTPDPTPGPTPTTGQLNVDVSLIVQLIPDPRSFRPGANFLRKKKLPQAKEELGMKGPFAVKPVVADPTISVVAIDSVGKVYPGVFEGGGGSPQELKKGPVFALPDIKRFTFPPLPPGGYTVVATADGFKEASQAVTVETGKTVQVFFQLVADPKKGGGKPTKPTQGGAAEWIRPDWFEKLYVAEDYFRWPWPPEPDVLSKFDPVIDPPPPEVDAWVEKWTDYLHAEHPAAPLDPGGIRLFIDKTHSPNAVADRPYAYLVFGDSGAYVPVVLTPKDKTLDRGVSLLTGGLPGVDAGAAVRFHEAGVISLDMLAAGWTGLVADVLGVGAEAAGGLITEARAKVDDLQGSLGVFSGVGTALETDLKGAGIDGPVALANADPAALVTAVGAGKLSLTQARLIVDEARGAVPASAWSLDAHQLGLDEQEVVGLKAVGVTTQGAFKSLAGTPQGKAAIATALKTTEAQVEATAGGIVLKSGTQLQADRRAAAPVTAVVGVNRNIGAALAGMGVASVRSLAEASPDKLAGVFGDVGRATEAVNAAKNQLGRGP